jgi:hypothetical protein
MELTAIVTDFAAALIAADALRPQPATPRTGHIYNPGIGPNHEAIAVRLIVAQLQASKSRHVRRRRARPLSGTAQRCDLGLGNPLEWVIEVKVVRPRGDNGKADGYLQDLLSPYESDHSALTDASSWPTRALPHARLY